MASEITIPRLGWNNHSKTRDERQTAYQVLVSSSDTGDVLWNSGKVVSDASYEVAYRGPKLRSANRYSWKVRTWDDTGSVSSWSEVAWFETAFFDPATEFTGSWIGRTASSLQQEPEPLLRKQFNVSEHVASARLYIAGLGYYKAYLNGEVVGDHELDPGFTDFSKRVYYVTYDVTAQLQIGANASQSLSVGAPYHFGLNTATLLLQRGMQYEGDPRSV